MTILCVFAVLNPLVVQAGFLLAPPAEEGGLSISQVFQGVAFLVGAVMVLLLRWTPNVHSSRLGRLLVLAMVCTAVFLGKSILESPDLPIMAFRGDAVFYFKIVFWCSSWFMIAILVRSESDATCLLRAMTLGAFLTAVIVVICFATGAGTIEVYAREGVRASVGVSGVSAKPTVPFLAAGAIIVVYLFGRARRLAGLVAAAVLLTATLVSYDRAVQVGLVAALVWFCVWRFALSARGRVGPAERIVIVGGLAGVLLFGSVGYQSLQKRWTADFEKGRPGSGRLGFYSAASERFAEGPPADVILGIGYSGIKQTMQERCDMAVHTHSDLFDLLLGGGLLGLGFYGAVFWSLGVYFRGVPVPSEEFVVMGAVGAVYVVMSLITGLLEATHAMFCLGVVFHCCHVRAVSRAEATRPADRKDSNRGIDTGAELLRGADTLLVQGEDPWQDPTGGIVSFTKCLLRAYGQRVAVASPSDAGLPVGVWTERSFEGRGVAFFNLGPLQLKRGKKPLVPAKIQVFGRVRTHMRTLHDCGVRNLLIDSAEVLFCAQRYEWESVCYFFHGLNNPVARSRYPWARILGKPYERRIVRALQRMRPDAIIAAADQAEVNRFLEGPGRSLDRSVVHSFATRVDRSVFFAEPRDAARAELGLDPDDLILVASARLSRTKGWRLLLETVRLLADDSSSVHLIFVGDGEDRSKIVAAASASGIASHVSITGFVSQDRVRTYLNSTDVCVVASHAEGWSLAMLEALACARPLVSTEVSGAAAMIREGKNGFIVRDRDPRRFAAAVRKAAVLPRVAEISSEIAGRYSLAGLAEDLGRIWRPLAMRTSDDLAANGGSRVPRGRGTADRR